MNAFESAMIKYYQKRAVMLRDSANKEGRYSLFNVKAYSDAIENPKSLEGIKTIFEIAKDGDKYLNIPYNVGVSLDFIANDPDTVVCIHRTRMDIDRSVPGLECSKELYDIMENGLINYGHTNIGGLLNVPSLSLTTTALNGHAGWINLLSQYHESNTVVIFGLPRAKFDENNNLVSGLVDDSLEIVDKSRIGEIYDLSGDNPRIKPEFIIGAVLNKDCGLDEFYTRDEMLQSMKDDKKL